MDGPCATQLTAAIACVDADPATCACYTQPFNETLINDFGGAFRMTLAFEIPGSDEFCTTANENVCVKLEASGECCCSTEIYDWLTCSFESDWSPAFGAGDCAFDQCGAAGSEGGSGGGGGSSMMIIIIAVAVTVLLCCCCCCCGCYYYRRNKRRAAEATANESTSKETKQGDESEHSWGDRDVESMGESIRKNKDKKSKRKGYDRNHSHSSSDEESESRRDNHRGRGTKMSKSKSKRSNYDSDSSREDDDDSMDDDDDSSKWSKRKGDGKSKKKLKKSKSRRGYNSNEDSDDYYSDQSESRRPKRRGNNKKRSEDSDDYSDEELSFRPKKNKNRGRDDSERPTVEESVRQARSILKAVKKSEKSPDAVTVEVQQVMNSELSAMIAQLKEQKQEMERRLRESETEATRLRLEKEASQRHIVQLETKAMETQKTLQMTQNEARNLQANQTLHVASKEAETMKVSAELEQVRKERSEMSKMIQKLEEARDAMQDKLIQAKDEALVLRTENNEATKKIHEVEKDREELRQKLAQIQQTRSDIERRLKDAEKEADDLRALKKAKGQEIREERASTHVRQSYVNEMEAERKDISRNLKRMENEKLQMIAMMEKLDSSRQRLDTLLEESPPFTSADFDDQSITFQDATNVSSNMSSNRSVNSSRSISDVRQQQGNRGSSNPTSNNPSTPVRPSRYLQPTLATIQSPRNMMVTSSPLGLPRPSSLKNLDQLTVVVPRSALQQQQQQQPADLRRTASAKALTTTDPRPAGWLGEDISNRSFNDLSIAAAARRKREPTEHVRTVGIPDTYAHYTYTNNNNETWDQVPPADESELLRRKRDKARESERRLRNEMQKSRSNRSMESSGSSFEPLY